jgi:accessory gene regulator B
MIEQVALRIATSIGKRNEGIVSVPVMKFAITIILDILSVISVVILLGLATNSLKEACLALFGFALLRFFSGGKHVKSSILCIIISVSLISIIIFTPIPLNLIRTIQIISFVLVAFFSPAFIENHIRIKKDYIPFLKIVSIIIVSSNFYWDSSILTKCFFIQSLTLLEIRRKGGNKNEKIIL